MKSDSFLRKRAVPWIVGVLLMFTCAGCSSFEHDWKKAVATPAPSSAVQGPWEGTWLSDRNGHTGRLRCLLTPIDDTTFQARFHATYAKVIKVGYSVKLASTPTATNTAFHGSANLGWLAGGVYEYAGHASPTNFFSTYRCKYDHGTFQLRRPN